MPTDNSQARNACLAQIAQLFEQEDLYISGRIFPSPTSPAHGQLPFEHELIHLPRTYPLTTTCFDGGEVLNCTFTFHLSRIPSPFNARFDGMTAPEIAEHVGGWCAKHGYYDPHLVDEDWWAFPSRGECMPVPLNFDEDRLDDQSSTHDDQQDQDMIMG